MAFVVPLSYRSEGLLSSGTPWVAVVHLFRPDGVHLTTRSSDIFAAGEGKSSQNYNPMLRFLQLTPPSEAAEDALAEMVAALQPLTYGDIAVQPFRVDVHGVEMGLIPDEPDEEYMEDYPTVTLWPNDLQFCPPWDGTYST